MLLLCTQNANPFEVCLPLVCPHTVVRDLVRFNRKEMMLRSSSTQDASVNHHCLGHNTQHREAQPTGREEVDQRSPVAVFNLNHCHLMI
jgi:hypothetical protein